MRLVPGIGITSGPCASSQASDELRDGAALVGGDRLDALDQRAVLLEILALEARVAARACRRRTDWRNRGSRRPAGCGRAANRRQRRCRDRGSWRASPRPPRDRAARIRSAPRRSDAPRGRGGCARGAPRTARESAPCPARPAGHRADRVLDRHIGVDAVLVIEVDDIDAEPLQAGLAGLLHIFGAAVDAVRRRPGSGSGRTWWRARPGRAGPSARGRAVPRSGPSRTCRSCRENRRRDRSRGADSPIAAASSLVP